MVLAAGCAGAVKSNRLRCNRARPRARIVILIGIRHEEGSRLASVRISLSIAPRCASKPSPFTPDIPSIKPPAPSRRPIHLSTTFEREPDGSYASGFVYSRSDNPNRHALEEAMAALEGGSGGGCVRLRPGRDRRGLPSAAAGRSRHRARGGVSRRAQATARNLRAVGSAGRILST